MDPQAPEHGFAQLLGLEIVEHTDEVVRGRLRVHDGLKQPYGAVHGGVFSAIAEHLASWATEQAVAPAGKVPSGMSLQTSYLRRISGGVIHAAARPRHRGRTTWVWDVEITDDEGRLCALSRMTIAVLERG